MIKSLLAVAALSLAVPALAQPAEVAQTTEVADPYGAASIAKGRFAKIEQKLEASYQKGDRSPEVLLNLAAIRLKQKRAPEAQTLLKAVLDQPNVDMATLTGNASSHALAQRGIADAVAMAR